MSGQRDTFVLFRRLLVFMLLAMPSVLHPHGASHSHPSKSLLEREQPYSNNIKIDYVKALEKIKANIAALKPYLENIQKARREGREYVTHGLRYLSRPISKLLIKYIPVTPNQVTIFSFLLGITAGLFLLQGGYKNHFIAGIFAMLYVLFDLMDGEIARAKNMASDLGKWLDGIIGIFRF